eukprot:2822547-Prymnesium_polylepis.1
MSTGATLRSRRSAADCGRGRARAARYWSASVPLGAVSGRSSPVSAMKNIGLAGRRYRGFCTAARAGLLRSLGQTQKRSRDIVPPFLWPMADDVARG